MGKQIPATWPLKNGTYLTVNGSKVQVSGKHSGISRVTFDWLEENACIDCEPNPYAQEYDTDDVRLEWYCEYCDGGSAQLFLTNNQKEE